MIRSKDRKGQSMVEFALILPVFILLMVGVFDFGRAIYAYNTINNAARQGARLAIVDQTIPHVQERAASEAVSLGIEPDDVTVDFRDMTTPGVANSCTAEVPGDSNNSGGIVFCIAVVTVEFDYDPVTPVIGNILGSLTLVGESQFKVDFNCEGPQCPRGE